MTEVRPGYFWCESCQEQIPDYFVNHFEKHVEVVPQAASDRIVTKDALLFWALCIAVGTIAALVVVVNG